MSLSVCIIDHGSKESSQEGGKEGNEESCKEGYQEDRKEEVRVSHYTKKPVPTGFFVALEKVH
jgi:hypothetical protein